MITSSLQHLTITVTTNYLTTKRTKPRRPKHHDYPTGVKHIPEYNYYYKLLQLLLQMHRSTNLIRKILDCISHLRQKKLHNEYKQLENSFIIHPEVGIINKSWEAIPGRKLYLPYQIKKQIVLCKHPS